MTREHVITARAVDPETGAVSFQTTTVPFTADEETAADAAAVPTEADYTVAIQNLIDETAQSKQYTDGNSCATYALLSASPSGTKWKEEGTAFVQWRANVWAYAFAQLAAYQSGQIAQPTVAGLLASLPTMTWPD